MLSFLSCKLKVRDSCTTLYRTCLFLLPLPCDILSLNYAMLTEAQASCPCPFGTLRGRGKQEGDASRDCLVFSGNQVFPWISADLSLLRIGPQGTPRGKATLRHFKLGLSSPTKLEFVA